MQKVGIFFGSNSGNTEDVAEQLKELIGDAELHDVSSASASDLLNYENIILGASTWGAGDLQDDFETFVEGLDSVDLTSKNIAIFGLGDSASYGDTFANSIAHIYNAVKSRTNIVGSISTDGYEYEESEAEVDGKFVGLPLDIDNESDKTEERLSQWVALLKQSFN